MLIDTIPIKKWTLNLRKTTHNFQYNRLQSANEYHWGCVSQLRAIIGHGGHFRLILILVHHCLPGIPFDRINLLEERPLLGILSLPGVGLEEAQLGHFFLLHQSALHAAQQVFHLVVPATLGNQLMTHHAVRVLLGVLVALVEVVQRERPAVGCLRHLN
jgi:hypothetical protein